MHLNLKQRAIIEIELESKSNSIMKIAKKIGFSRKTIYDEIKNNSNYIKSKSELFLHQKPQPCIRLSKFPFVCNYCEKQKSCSKQKRIYDAYSAEQKSKILLSKSRSKPQYSKEFIEKLDKAITPLIRSKFSIYHILNSIPDIKCSESTIRRYIDKCYLTARNYDLLRAPQRNYSLKEYRRKRDFVPVRILLGRDYKEFQAYINAYPRKVIQIDTVFGTRDNNKVILTIFDTKTKLQFGYFIRNRSMEVSVIILKLYDFCIKNKINFFDTILTDNGHEMQDLPKYEFTEFGELRFKVFYCDPYNSGQKGECERNHEFIRYYYRKGKSFDGISQRELLDTFIKINSIKRKSLNKKCPLDLARDEYGQNFLNYIFNL